MRHATGIVVGMALGAGLGLAGCNQLLGVTDPHLHDDAGAPDDGASDGGACVADHFGYTISNIASCDIPAPTTSLRLPTAMIDTTTGVIRIAGGTITPQPATAIVAQAGGPSVRVIAVTSLTIPVGATVDVTGQYGLIIVSTGDVTIDGTLTASANHSTAAAGSRDAMACGSLAGAVGSGADPFTGGCGGGGHGQRGGAGGSAFVFANTGTTTNVGGAGGSADSDVALRPLVGGCPGGVRTGDTAAAGGGAIQISAAGPIDIQGTIAAAGGGAVPIATAAPAPAGGSGGGILLEAPVVTMASNAAVTANGGGGADGGATTAGCGGQNGSLATATPAAGGSCSADVSGGAGGAGSTPAHGGDDGARGTGGGGAVGRIAIHAGTVTQGIVSPAANVEPL